MKLDRRFVRNLTAAGLLIFFLIHIYLFTERPLLDAIRPILIGIALAYLLNILIVWFEKHDFLYHHGIIRSEKLHRGLCMVAAIVLLLAMVTLVVGYMIPMLTNNISVLLGKVPGGIRYILDLPFLKKIVPEDTLQELRNRDWNNWINELVSTVNSDDLVRSMTSTASSAFSAFSSVSFGILFAIYFLAGRHRFHDQLVRVAKAFLPHGREERFFRYTGMLNACFHDFIVCQGLQAVIMFVVSTLFLMIFRFPYALMIGALSGICALLPIIGGYIAAAMGTLMILTDSPDMALVFLVLIIVIQNVVGTLIFPRLASQSMGLPPVWTLAAVTVGSGMAGFTGIVIGVPLVAFAYRCLGEEVRKRERAERGRKRMTKTARESTPPGMNAVPDGADSEKIPVEQGDPGTDAPKAESPEKHSADGEADSSILRRMTEKFGEKVRLK